MEQKILVTGATGKTSTELIKLLLNKNFPVKAAVRNLDSFKFEANNLLEICKFDYSDINEYDTLFMGVDKLYLVLPPSLPDFLDYVENIALTAKKAGIEKIVYLTALGVDEADGSSMFEAELIIKRTGIPYAFLRPNWFMQNFTTGYLKDILENNEISLPAGDALVSFIDVRDIALAAYYSLLNNTISNVGLTLTGTKAISFNEVAECISNVSGRNIKYKSISDDDYLIRLTASGYDKSYAKSMIWLYQAVRRGYSSIVTNDFQILTHLEPRSFSQFAKDIASVWK